LNYSSTSSSSSSSLETSLSSTVEALKEKETKLNNRIRIIQHVLQLVLTENDDLENEKNLAHQSQSQLEMELVTIQETHNQMESRYKTHIEDVEKKLQSVNEHAFRSETERKELKEKLFIERQRNVSERRNDQARFDTLLRDIRDNYDIQLNRLLTQQNSTMKSNEVNDDDDDDDDELVLTKDGASSVSQQSNKKPKPSTQQGKLYRRIWGRIISPRSWFRSKKNSDNDA